MIQDIHVLDLASAVYDAAMVPERWADTLQTLSAAFDADEGAIGCLDKCRHHFTLAANSRGDIQAVNDDTARPMMLDHRLLAGFKYRAGSVFWRVARRCPDIRTPAHLSNLFNGEADDHFLGLVIEDDWRKFKGVYVTRPAEALPFGDEEMALFARLGDHFVRALKMHAFTKHTERDRHTTLLVLDHLAMGVVIVDVDGRILQRNVEAQEILDVKDGLLVEADVLRNTVRPGNKRFVAGDPRGGIDAEPRRCPATDRGGRPSPIDAALAGASGRALGRWARGDRRATPRRYRFHRRPGTPAADGGRRPDPALRLNAVRSGTGGGAGGGQDIGAIRQRDRA